MSLLGRLFGTSPNAGQCLAANESAETASRPSSMPRKKSTESAADKTNDAVATIRHPARRKNIPPAGLEAQGVIEKAPKFPYEYNPHLPPVLRSSTEPGQTDKLPELLETARKRALSAEEAQLLAEALRKHEPWLEWSGKREKPWFEVDPVALHMHERISTQAILRVLAREDVQRDLFADPQQEYAKAVQFYRWDMDWANRMILGDSLQVMASLAQREDLMGKVQMIYVDPPYGIKFSSNFQPQLGQRDVRDREQDLTREPEMVKAYRDTWTLGIHSYLAYLRDRLSMAKELLADSGSIFVQIGDENLHRVRGVLDEVFGPHNFISTIVVRKTATPSSGLDDGAFYLLWFARNREKLKFVPLYAQKPCEEWARDTPGGSWGVQIGDLRRSLTPEEKDDVKLLPEDAHVYALSKLTSAGSPSKVEQITALGQTFDLNPNEHWKTSPEGIARLEKANRLECRGRLWFTKFYNDGQFKRMMNVWTDTAGKSSESIYVVQTQPDVVARCMLMTTDPGDLVLDPTCGSGTTAFVAEQWGRRWITCDSSRVALALAKHRLMTAKFDYYQLRPVTAEDLKRNPNGTWLADPTREVPGKATFQCETVPHITLKSIARNASLDPIFAKYEPILAKRLKVLNGAAAEVGAHIKEKLVEKLMSKHREEGASAVTNADTRRWLLPDTDPALLRPSGAKKPLKTLTPQQVETYRAAIPKHVWREWEVPFDLDSEWPQPLQDAFNNYRTAWRAKMEEVNACIEANAVMEELVDQPEVQNGVVRVSGPFTMEGVIAAEEGPDTPIGGAPDELEAFDGEAAVLNAEAHLDKIIRLLRASGVDFPGNKNMKFRRLDPLTGASLLHAEGEWMNGDQTGRRVAISVGPEVGNVTAMQVEDVIRAANRKGYDDVVFAGFGFDAAAQDAIEGGSHPKLRLHMALIRPDVAMGDLLKTQPGSQLFTVFSAPRVNGPNPSGDGDFTVEVEGMDVYDPVSNTLFPTDKQRIAAWFLDTDYDGRTFCICQAFFPDKSKWSKLAKALGAADVVEEDAFEALSGLTSLPFPRPERLGAGETWRVAVKVIDPRGNEGLKVLTIN